MVQNVKGFKLEVTERNGQPHVRVSLRNGTVVVDTDEVSIEGLRNMAEVFEAASGMASQELEHYYACKHENLRKELNAHGREA